MKKRNRLLALLLACLCLLSLVGCGNSGKEDNEKEDEPEKTPEYTAATTDNNIYRSEFAGLTATLGADWQVLTQAEIAQVVGLTAELTTSEDYKKALSSGQSVFDLYAMTATGSSVNITVGDVGVLYGKLLDTDVLAQTTSPQLVAVLESMGLSDVQAEVTKITFAGAQEAAVNLTGTMQGVTMYETQVYKKVGNYVYSITACTYGEDGTADILALFQSL